MHVGVAASDRVEPERAARVPAPPPPHAVLELQRTHGNHAVARLLSARSPGAVPGLQRVQHDWMLPGSDLPGPQRLVLEEEAAAREQQAQERLEPLYQRRREEERRDAEAVGQKGLVGGAVGHAGTVANVRRIKVGVSFRTDSNGQAHVEHDRRAVEAMNQLEDMPVSVEAVTLPRGASGGATPQRAASAGELADIDMLYIPGAPTANDTQTGMDGESRDFNRPLPPQDPGPAPVAPVKESMSKGEFNAAQAEFQKQNKEYKQKKTAYDGAKARYDRIMGEHRSRAAYELKLIAMARDRGIPTIAICAGSWRLLEAYGGQVETLPPEERALHKAPQTGDTWKIGHGVEIEGDSLLGSMTGPGTAPDVNSTHWAVASTDQAGRLRQRPAGHEGFDPGELLDVSATATGKETLSDKELKVHSVEAFETRRGVPTLGIQWHPEAYLPGMQGQDSGSLEARHGSRAIFSGMAEAAAASGQRRHGVNEQILGRERDAFTMLGQALEAFVEGKDAGAGELYKAALEALPQAHWSARMDELDDALAQLGRARDLEAQQKEQEATELRQRALETMQRHGFGAH